MCTQVVVDRPATVNNIAVSGPGVNPKYCRANTPINFKVDASKSAKGNLDVKMLTDKGENIFGGLFTGLRNLIYCNIYCEKILIVFQTRFIYGLKYFIR